MENQLPPIDLNNTTPIFNHEGGVIFQQGVLMRKVSKFVTGTKEDALLPIPIFFDPTSLKILIDSVPKELREELKDYIL